MVVAGRRPVHDGPRLLTHRPPIPRLESFPAEIEARNAQLPADFVWQPFDISLETERTVGLVGLAAFAVGILVLLATRRTFRRAWWWIIAAPVVAGMTLAWSHRIMTAGVGGANFGAGIVSFLVLPALLVGLSVAASFAYRLLRNPYSHRGLPLPPDA